MQSPEWTQYAWQAPMCCPIDTGQNEHPGIILGRYELFNASICPNRFGHIQNRSDQMFRPNFHGHMPERDSMPPQFYPELRQAFAQEKGSRTAIVPKK